ncbi:MAG: 4Fe-4S binding protein [Alphaproteobacteria bacterium]
MKINKKKVLVCDCEGSMPIEAQALARACAADEAPTVYTQLCRAQLGEFQRAVLEDQTVVVACTQEAPLFAEVQEDNNPEAELRFTNIRERAGWSDEAGQATAKIAALLAEAVLDVPPTPGLTLESAGVALVYGRDEQALEAAKRLASRLDVTVLLTDPRDVPPPLLMDVPVFKGTVTAASGHLGAFEIGVDDYAPTLPSSRGAFVFDAGRNGATSRCDLILDLTGGPPLFPAPDKRDGYFNPDPGDPAQVERALFDIADMVGTYEKPIYVAFDDGLCAHSRSRITGCTRCLDVCPTSAIAPAGDHVKIDPHVCAGCGSCASVCPTGAAAYALPAENTVYERLRTLLGAFREAGGAQPTLLVHDARYGDEMIHMIARHGRGLPARVLPFALNEATQVGLEFFAVALAYGATRVRVLTGPGNREHLPALEGQIALAETVMEGLGYGAGRVALIDAEDPDAVESALWSLEAAPATAAASFLPMGGKRTVGLLALRHLHASAPAPVEAVPLPAGAPFGAIVVNQEGCTLCLSCVGACPTGAIIDNPDRPMLRFLEEACVQCGLCRTTCPESVIALEPRLSFAATAHEAVAIKEEEPFSCVRCGKPFGVRSSIERMVERLAGHEMFADEAALDRLRMCEDCRVIVQFEVKHPMAARPRPLTRTTDDDLREREQAKAREMHEKAGKTASSDKQNGGGE